MFEIKPNPDYRPDSIYNTFRSRLFNNGLFEDQADAILKQAVDNRDNEAMKGRWNDRPDDYPPMMVNFLFAAVKEEALTWIDKNMPQHWARPLFTPNPEETLRQKKAQVSAKPAGLDKK